MAATLHLMKLSVGSDDVADLAGFQARRLAAHGAVWHVTRSTPKRADELLEGGSIYWSIRGRLQARQRLIGFETDSDEQERPRCRIMLDPELVPTAPRSIRPFQGWRYLPAADAPPDMTGNGPGQGDSLPPELVEELRRLGLW
ncbi:hypothetical protein EDC65_4575 [Stella humosa]|uniref:DUF1489 family protein n=1 Tax=Stella humosa TaxID=94 RepID=A0A3N1L0E3_9PROT|nr:DUF1489 domain-containing protein [Stella humosa]ROP83926.1 hypothetical protein EDC65_4575 [Stella humosa]BBK32812.1 hypothetical protein STHU_34460 [Stella humosa]